MCKIEITNVLFNNEHVNNYTKLLILLDNLSYYHDYCIVSKKLCNMLKIDKRSLIKLLNQLVDDNIIYLYYENNKRFFNFVDSISEKQKVKKIELIDYDYLNED